jgi:hypothetical protein
MSLDRLGIERKLTNELWRAIQRAIAVAVLIPVHWSLQRLLRLTFGDLPEYAKVEQLAEAAALLAFLLIYGRLLFEMVAIFWPLRKAASNTNDQKTLQK